MPTKKDKLFTTNYEYGAFERSYGTRIPEDMLDAFSRLRMSEPITIFDSDMEYDKQPLIWNEATNGASSEATHLPNESSVLLSIGTASDDYVIRQTREYFRYQPGKSHLMLITFVFGSPQTNTKKLAGYFNDQNGIYLEQNGTDLYIVRRYYTSGTVQEERVHQTDWNVDTMDANSDIGLFFQSHLAQILVIDLEWLGVGRVRVGFNIDGQTLIAHEFLHANVIDSVYMTSATLPLRYEIRNVAAVDTAPSMKQICSTVVSEGGATVTRSYPFLITTGDTLTAVTTAEEAVLAIRPATTFKGKDNRISIRNIVANVFAQDASAIVRLWYNAGVTGGTWTTVDAESAVEYNTTMTGFTPGLIVSDGIVPAATAGNTRVLTSASASVDSQLPFSFDIDGGNPDIYLITVRSLTGTANVRANIDWNEVR